MPTMRVTSIIPMGWSVEVKSAANPMTVVAAGRKTAFRPPGLGWMRATDVPA